MKKILITGGAGFIGYNLTKKLTSEGFKVTILDNLSSKIHSDNSKYNDLKDISNFIIGDVCVREDWEKAIIDQDAVIHLASETGTGQSMYDIHHYTNVNVGSTALLMDILTNTKHSIKKILLSSSRAVYGEGKYLNSDHKYVFPNKRSVYNLDKLEFDFIDENKEKLIPVSTDEDSKINPLSLYSLTKYNQEQVLELLCPNLGIQPIILRYQNVYGPGQSLSNPYTGILSIFSTRILNNNNIEIYEDGLQTRDFVYIDDVVNITYSSLISKNLKFSTYNVGSGHAQTVMSVAEKLKEYFKSEIDISVSNRYRLGDIRHNFADISRLSSDFDCSSFLGFEKGLLNFVEWVKKQNVQKDLYEDSIGELSKKGILR